MTTQQQTKPPVKVSGDATRALAAQVRQWTGWPKAKIILGRPERSPYAAVDYLTQTVTINPDALVLNPNRVLLTLTPFRLRQEAVLTGAVLHEAAHARYSLWRPRTPEQAETFAHGDGEKVTEQTFALALLCEEARIEGLMAANASKVGAHDLDWTMRASAAALLPVTELSTDPNQQIMDLITSWTLRAGRQIALYQAGAIVLLPAWVHHFTALLIEMLTAHLDGDSQQARTVYDMLKSMITWDGVNYGPTLMQDTARGILSILFPETDGDDENAPMPGGACAGMPMPPQEQGESESDESGEGGATSSTSEDEAEGDEAEGDEAESEDEGDGDGEAESESESESEQQALAERLAQALAQIEADADSDTEAQSQAKSDQAPPPAPEESPSKGAGSGGSSPMGGGWRSPAPEERDTAHEAERFLRDLLDPSETSTRSLTDQPSAEVDGAALSAWKAGGMVRAPHFFVRTRRQAQPAPPVKIAILVDISGSMDEMQKPSAVLSWALASAALDLRNFAGRGQQVESCLIHWGWNATVIQRNGQVLPGIREVPCREGTSAMSQAFGLIEKEMPGFFDITEKPVNRLIVQFTDWGLDSHRPMVAPMRRAMEAGINMLSVVPNDYSPRWSDLSTILAQCPIQRGVSSVLKYNPRKPNEVWTTAAEALRDTSTGAVPAPSAGF